MKKVNRLLAASLCAMCALFCISVYSQVNRPFKNGTAWTLAMIRVRPGMGTAYMNYLATDWKRNQEASKKEGLIVSYRVLTSPNHNPNEWNLLLMTEYKDLATMEANEEKQDALAQKLIGDDQKQIMGYKERAEIRDVLGSRLAREVVFK